MMEGLYPVISVTGLSKINAGNDDNKYDSYQILSLRVYLD
jgi:hypothetical protein